MLKGWLAGIVLPVATDRLTAKLSCGRSRRGFPTGAPEDAVAFALIACTTGDMASNSPNLISPP